MQVGEGSAQPHSTISIMVHSHTHNLSHEGNVNKAKRWMHTMYSEGVAPTPRVFANLLTVYMRSMTKVLSVHITILCPVRYLISHTLPRSLRSLASLGTLPCWRKWMGEACCSPGSRPKTVEGLETEALPSMLMMKT